MCAKADHTNYPRPAIGLSLTYSSSFLTHKTATRVTLKLEKEGWNFFHARDPVFYVSKAEKKPKKPSSGPIKHKYFSQ